jgi:hypothetical protein
VVDAGDEVVELVHRNANILGQLVRRVRHAVAQTHRPDSTRAVDRPAIHRHRIHIVQESDVGAEFFHVAANV